MVLILFSCVSKSEREANKLYDEAQLHFKKGEYDLVILKISNALDLVGDRKTGTKTFNNGSVFFLRGKAYEVQNNFKKAIPDYKNAIAKGKKYANSYALSSNPKPMAIPEFLQRLGIYFSSLGKSYAMIGEFEKAYDAYLSAINAAYQGINRSRGFKFRNECLSYVGAYYYNIGLLQERLGIKSSTICSDNDTPEPPDKCFELARKLNYRKDEIITIIID